MLEIKSQVDNAPLGANALTLGHIISCVNLNFLVRITGNKYMII